MGQWHCTSTSECERQKEPPNPAKKGFDTEDECLAAAPVDCAPPCEETTCTDWEVRVDDDGHDYCWRSCCPSELKPDINGDLTCMCKEGEDSYEEISYDVDLCGGKPIPPCPPKACTVTLYANVNEGNPQQGQADMNQALKITVDCLLSGNGYSGQVTPPGASRPVYASVVVGNAAGQEGASIGGGGFETSTRLNLPVPGATPLVARAQLWSIASLGYTGSPSTVDDSGAFLPDPPMTWENVCKGITTYKLPAYRYADGGGPVGQIWAGYKWYYQLEYLSYFDSSDGYGGPLTYIEVKFSDK
jgi:hypothetical protein